MTQNEIIEMAKQACIKRRTDEFYSEFCDGIYFDDLEAFAKLVAAKEREACANLAEDFQRDRLYTAEMAGHIAAVKHRLAVRIRARSEA